MKLQKSLETCFSDVHTMKLLSANTELQTKVSLCAPGFKNGLMEFAKFCICIYIDTIQDGIVRRQIVLNLINERLPIEMDS